MLSRKISRSVRGLLGLLFAVGLMLAATPAQAITYGTPDPGHPFVGAMVITYKGQAYEWCSGTLIAPRVFLTAGHCTIDLSAYVTGAQDVHISFGPNVVDPATWHDVESWEASPAYNWGPMSDPHDVGVVILKDPVSGLGFGALAPDAGFLDGLWAQGKLNVTTQFLNVGYGSDQNFADTNVREFSWSSFRNLHKAWIYLSQNVHTGNGGTCFGDSGGPTFYVDDAGNEYVVAVTSWGDAMCKSTNNNYRVDTTESLAFIADVVAQYAS